MSVEDFFIQNNLDERRKQIATIFAASPMFDAEILRIDNRSLVDSNGHWLADFATQDYLGLEFEPSVQEAAIDATRRFGPVIFWCRLVATVDLFNEAERQVAELIGTESVNIFASTTLLNHGVIPALLGKDGVMFLDKTGHATMYEGAKIARDSGATLVSFPTGDLDILEQKLQEYQHVPKKLIATDGVFSMTGEYPDLARLDALAKKYNALIFVDDAHGFGVVGENPSPEHPFGHRGNGIVKHLGLNYDNILYVGCFSKAYGTFGSFIGCSRKMREFLLSQATPHDLGGAGPASAMAALLAGLAINRERGDEIRQQIHANAHKAITGLRNLGYTVDNHTGFPILSVWLGDSGPGAEVMIEASKILYDHHILLTLAPYPMVQRGKEAFRITVTATNSEQEIDQLLTAFAAVKAFLEKRNIPLQRKIGVESAS